MIHERKMEEEMKLGMDERNKKTKNDRKEEQKIK
jgi:hypothetical protein